MDVCLSVRLSQWENICGLNIFENGRGPHSNRFNLLTSQNTKAESSKLGGKMAFSMPQKLTSHLTDLN